MLQSNNIYILLNIFSVLHILEEYVWPGGFDKKFKVMARKIGLNITTFWLVLTNLMFIGVVISTLIVNNRLFCLSVFSIILINALLHIGKSIQAKGYFPGVVTASLFYFPLAIYSFLNSDLNYIQKGLAFTLGLLMHLSPFLVLIIKNLFIKFRT